MTLCRKSFSAAEELTHGTPIHSLEPDQPPRVTRAVPKRRAPRGCRGA